MRKVMTALALLGLAACTEPTGGSSYSVSSQYARERELILQGGGSAPGGTSGGVPAAPSVSSQPLSAMSAGTAAAASATAYSSGSSIAADTEAALNSGQTPLQASPSNPPPEAINALGISQENNFDAVGEQRSAQQDAAFIAENRARYEQVQPTALPERAEVGPNLAAYALQTSTPVGQPVYSRSTIFAESRHNRNCAQYPSPDLAQSDFLKRGGPNKDPRMLDPDGDGYACSWDPAPFRRAAAAANG
ncbi:hypothetical protein [Pseudooceanicola algae]|uniref:Excalibur calcium-binding domain-containing protein n=1 Tax=Pseudooceanicola algae TaxID=1537215 RepID=A0A418SI60_9RHOB|nr:hypothetical protein [Pseudooceanicola algae]QPM92084.1 hypothetical protein PSAL_033470 [Pseudooceanicola algae]